MPLKRIIVGCCGFPVARTRYFSEFKLVELQNTFYNLPTEEEATRLRNSIPADAIVTMKAWQVLTHPSSSPTWRKMKRKPNGNLEKYGFLKPTKENLEAWNETLRIAQILNVRAIILQTPPSFGFSEENLRNVIKFFTAALSTTPRDLLICWEPRCDWNAHPEALQRVLELGIIHVTDILRVDPLPNSRGILYTRLHGLGGKEVNYRYRYTDNDLTMLIQKILKHEEEIEEAYVLFNNIYMFEDAKRFREKLRAVFHGEVV